MRLLEYLPAIYQDPTDGDDPSEDIFLGRFLMAFQAVMLSSEGGDSLEIPVVGEREDESEFARHVPGSRLKSTRRVEFRRVEKNASTRSLEDEIAGLPRYFDAESTPAEFLDWLAGWVALALRADLSPYRQRRLLANTARLYRIRGTRRCIEEVLKLYVDGLPSVTDEDSPSLQIAVHSTVGLDTYLGGGASFLFQVRLALSHKEADFVARQSQLARAVIDLERPAHTGYEFRVTFPRVQIGVHSTVGVDTVLAP
jgi:phage tail-like protein